MATYKLFKNGELVNTIVADLEFLQSISDQWDTYEEVIENPQPQPEPQPTNRWLSAILFKMRFTPQERVTIRTQAETDLVLKDFLELIDDPRLISVDLNLPEVSDALDYLISKGIITQQRKQEILA